MRGPKPLPIRSTGFVLRPPPKPPTGMKGEARKEWKRITTLLARHRILCELDRAALMIYCTTYAHWRLAERHLAMEGEVVPAPRGGEKLSPWIAIQRHAFECMRPMLAEFGLTPSARARLKLDDRDADAGDEFFGGA